MKSLSSAEYLYWNQHLVGLDWPLTAEQFTRVAAGFGWVPDVVRNTFVTTLPYPSTLATIRTGPENQIIRIDLNLTQVVRDKSASWEIHDLFVDYYNATTETFGQPARVIQSVGYKYGWWPLRNRTLMALGASRIAASFTVHSPDGRAFLDWE